MSWRWVLWTQFEIDLNVKPGTKQIVLLLRAFDIGDVFFDDQASLIRPALTTVSQPLEKMGRVATQMLLDLLRQPEREARRIELSTELVIRDSCQIPREL